MQSFKNGFQKECVFGDMNTCKSFMKKTLKDNRVAGAAKETLRSYCVNPANAFHFKDGSYKLKDMCACYMPDEFYKTYESTLGFNKPDSNYVALYGGNRPECLLPQCQRVKKTWNPNSGDCKATVGCSERTKYVPQDQQRHVTVVQQGNCSAKVRNPNGYTSYVKGAQVVTPMLPKDNKVQSVDYSTFVDQYPGFWNQTARTEYTAQKGQYPDMWVDAYHRGNPGGDGQTGFSYGKAGGYNLHNQGGQYAFPR